MESKTHQHKHTHANKIMDSSHHDVFIFQRKKEEILAKKG